ncbi:hypothetical protein PHYC_00151 [Phycisphaerales bacterium]|nr:hypothetical protein PHYC_00151 [Phycisphaerales bacterium]
MSDPTTDNPFAVLTFLAAPAILTNASTLLALSTSNRLGKVSDRARAASAALLGGRKDDPHAGLHRQDFEFASTRATMLVEALRLLYLATGSFAAGTCVALIGAFAGYFGMGAVVLGAQVLTITLAVVGVAGLGLGSARLLAETRLALRVFAQLRAAMTEWDTAKGGAPPGAVM